MDLKNYLTNLKMTHSEFADKLGVSQVTVTRYVNSTRKPSMDMAFKIQKLTKRKVKIEDWFEEVAK